MPQARVFVPQDAVETWLGEGRASIDRDSFTYGGVTFEMSSAVRFLREVTGGTDTPRLVGRVKSREQLELLAADHSGDSVVLGENAYEVVEGYLLRATREGGVPVPQMQKLFAQP